MNMMITTTKETTAADLAQQCKAADPARRYAYDESAGVVCRHENVGWRDLCGRLITGDWINTTITILVNGKPPRRELIEVN